MPAPPSHPPSRAPASGLRLTLSIALGVWLGLLMAGLTGWLILRWADVGPLAVVATAAPPANLAAPAGQRPAASPPAPSSAMPAAAPSPDGMFDQYQRNLEALNLRQLEEAARANPANLNNPKCQFWLEQARTAPAPNNQENIARFCAP